MRCHKYCVLFSGFLTGIVFLLSCGGGSSTNSSNSGMEMATVNVSLSDPSTCSAPNGPFSHIYVTVTDVLINQSASASDNDPSWVDLTPNLKSSPAQVDLLGIANQCFLATLGSAGIQPGTYQQLRVLLASNNTSVTGNKCGSSANCVMLTNDPLNTPQPLQLSSESQTGIKIPSGQIAGGQFVVQSGQTLDLNLDFNACASIVTQGNSKYRLKPVLHAGEVSTTSSSTAISGTIIDGVTQQPVSGGNTVVILEQKDNNGVDRVVMETVTGSNGGFGFCPVAAGTYDVVAVAINGAGNTYSATVITGVQSGDSLGTIPLTPAGVPASITGQVTTSTGIAATAADLSLSALQPAGSGLLVTVPLAGQSAATATITTVSGPGCAANTDCGGYTLSVPGANPSIGAFVSGGNQKPNPPAAGAVNYSVDAEAFVPNSAAQADCSPSDLQTNMTSSNTPLVVTPGGNVTAATLAFTGCQ